MSLPLQKEMLHDWVQHKCQLSDLPLMRWHLWQEGRKLLLLEKTQKYTDVLPLRADKKMLKGIKLFYISYICMSVLKCSTLFVYTVLGLQIQLRWRGIESITVHQRYVQSDASSNSINVTQVLQSVLTQLIALPVISNHALSEIARYSLCKCHHM